MNEVTDYIVERFKDFMEMFMTDKDRVEFMKSMEERYCRRCGRMIQLYETECDCQMTPE